MPTPSKKTLTILFTVSLVLNVFFGGLIVSHLWHVGGGWDGPRYARHAQWRDLPDEQREAFRGLWKQHREEFKASLGHMRDARQRLRESLEGKSERAELEAAMQAFDQELLGIKQGMTQRLLDAAMTLPPEHRADFLAMFGTPPGRRHRH